MIKDILQTVDTLDPKTNYWFVRTEGGLYFDSFYKNDFIAIGWDDINLKDLKKTEPEIKDKLAISYQLDYKLRGDKAKATEIYNKLKRFKELKKNDVIIIPSESSKFLAFGVIADDNIYEAKANNNDCPYIKRRKVKWVVEPKPFELVDDVFYKIRKSQHAISNVSQYADHIDSEMYNVYSKNDTSHFVVNVKQEGQINWKELALTLLEMHELMAEINKEFKLNENVEDGAIQIAIQSPGLFNLCQKGVALILLATALGSSSCSNVTGNFNAQEKQHFEKFEQKNKDTLQDVKTKLLKMQVHL